MAADADLTEEQRRGRVVAGDLIRMAGALLSRSGAPAEADALERVLDRLAASHPGPPRRADR